MMNRRTILGLCAAACMGVLFVLPGCSKKGNRITVGGKDFDEQTIVGEMAAQLIEDRMGVQVVRTFNLAVNLPSRLIRTGEIDLYLDYSGTGYMDILAKKFEGQSSDEIYTHVKEVFPKQFGVEWLEPLGFNNTYTLTMRREQAEKLGIKKISDLKNHTDLTAGFDPSFLDREDGYPGLTKHYGFKLDSDPKQLAIGLMYKACQEGSVDIIDAFATDGRIRKFDLVVLEDDRQFFPPYDAALNVRVETLSKYPKLRETLSLLSGTLDDTTMQQLNYTVSEEGRKEADVAREFLVSKGLLEKKSE